MGKETSTIRLEDDGVIRAEIVGNVNEVTAKKLIEQTEEIITDLHAQNKKVLFLVDLTRAGTGSTATRARATDFFKRIRYDRLAYFGANKQSLQTLRYIINTVGRIMRIRLFKTEPQARKWLKKTRTPQNKATRALVIAGLLTILAGMWQVVIGPYFTRLPDNFSYQATLISYDNFYNEQKGGYSGRALSSAQFNYEVTGTRDGVLDIKNRFDVQTAAGEKIFAVERTYGIDQQTREHVPSRGDRPRLGYLFGPATPLTSKNDFVYWHINYDEPAVMKFQGEEDILGLKTHRYKAIYTADQTNDLKYLPEVGVTRGVNLDIILELWIEPVTGHFVKYEDFTTGYYYNLSSGERLNPWNQFSNSYTFESVAAQVQRAEQEKRRKTSAETNMPIFLAFLAACFLVRWAIIRWQEKRLSSLASQSKATAWWQVVEHSKNVLLSLSVLGGLLFVTWLTWQQAIVNTDKQTNIQFQGDANDLQETITKELDAYVKALEGARGLFAASTDVSREEWQAYVDSLELAQYYPGMLGLGFAQMVPPEQKDTFVNQVRREGFPSYNIHPSGARDLYSAVLYIEPFNERNQRAFGYDMFADPVRREAMERARDTGEPAMSGKVTLVQETGANPEGVLIYLPVYQKGMPLTSPEERRAALIGFVYTPIRMADFMLVTLGNQTHGLNVSLFDTAEVNNLKVEDRLYVAHPQYGIENTSYRPAFLRTETTLIAGRQLTVRYVNLPGYNSNTTAQAVPGIILFSGVTLSLLLATITFMLGSSRARALNLARTMTLDLRHERDAAITNQHKNEAILHSIGDGVFVLDPTGKIKLFNKAAELISGVSARDVLGRPYKEVLTFENEKDGQVVDSFITNALAGTPGAMARHTILRRLDGMVVPVADSAAPIFNSRGGLEGAVVVFRDISHERQLERAKDEFLSMASHELRTPMGAIRANAAMMLGGDYGQVNKGLVEPLNDIHASSVRLVELVNDLLNASRIEAGRMKFTLGEYDVHPLIKKTVSDLAPLVKEKGLHLTLTPAHSAKVQVDPERLRQVITNLVGNALKFTDKGSIKLAVTIDDNVAVVSITDTGIGIPPQEQSKLFGKFSQISSAQDGKPAGTGLGLYISREIMRKMGGELWLKNSAAGKGSTFALTVPLVGTPLARKALANITREAAANPDQK